MRQRVDTSCCNAGHNTDLQLNGLIVKALDLFFRRYYWKVNFFWETRNHTPLGVALASLFRPDIQAGSEIGRYEAQYQKLLNTSSRVFSFGAARMALYAVLKAMGIRPGDEVIVPAFTCEVVVHSLRYLGVVPIYGDIEPYTFNLDDDHIAGRISRKTKAIIAQHTFGIPCDMDQIMRVAKKHNLFVIEDCALALGSTYKGKPVGTIGHAAIFSSDRTKVISTQWGGVAVANDRRLSGEIKKIYETSPFLSRPRIRNIGLQVLLSHLLFSPFSYYMGKYLAAVGYRSGLLFDHLDDRDAVSTPTDYPCRLSNLQSIFGLSQLAGLGENLALRKRMVSAYFHILTKKNIDLEVPAEKRRAMTLRFSVMLKDRDTFISKHRKYFEVGTWFDSPAIGWDGELSRIGYDAGSCPVAEQVHRHIINFPTHQTSPAIRTYLYRLLGSIDSSDILLPSDILCRSSRSQGILKNTKACRQ